MEYELQNPAEILDRLSGFHQYRLTEPARLCYVSRSLCDMLEMPREALLCDGEDRYALCLHPDDRASFGDFLGKLRQNPGTWTLRCRLMTGSGRVIYVSDTATSYPGDGGMMADCVLTDITEWKEDDQNFRFLNETLPFGFVRYTCEKTPGVTWFNAGMRKILRIPERTESGYDPLDIYRRNLYAAIPVEERERFARYLERVTEQDSPLAGEIWLLRADGTKARVFGWVAKCRNEQGEPEFQSAFMDITDQYTWKKKRETETYLKALTEVYDKIFEFDLAQHTVKCLYSQNSPMFRWLENIPMQMEEATENWITGTAEESDRQRLRDFFGAFYRGEATGTDGKPPRIVYRAKSSSGNIRTYTGIFLRLDRNVSLYCCRNTPDAGEADALRRENSSLKNMQALALRFTEGVVAFEVENNRVRPLYTSENVCSFFGYTREEWTALAEQRPSIGEFVARSGVNPSDISRLFSAGEAEFSYFDMTRQAYRRIRAICSRRDEDGGDRCYVMLYNADAREPESDDVRVRIRTFGYFDVFVDEQPIAFRNEKSKELFALLTDRRGGFVSSEEAISFLWEDEPANSITMARYRKVALRLKNILEEYGISDIIESVNGKRRLIPERVRCDLYDYLSGGEAYSQLFKGSYLTNYSWGENTLAELMGEYLHPME